MERITFPERTTTNTEEWGEGVRDAGVMGQGVMGGGEMGGELKRGAENSIGLNSGKKNQPQNKEQQT